MLRSLDRPASGDQVNDRHDQSNDQKQVNQPAGHMKSPTQEPQDDKDRENCPEHKYPLNQIRASTAMKCERQLLRPELSLRGGISERMKAGRDAPELPGLIAASANL